MARRELFLESLEDRRLLAGDTSLGAEIVFIDSAVSEQSTLVAGIDDEKTVVQLDASSSGLQQIVDYLDGKTDIAAVHVISHGDFGEFVLSDQVFTDDNIAQFTTEFSAIGQSLAADGDLLFYGCNIAASADGVQMLHAIGDYAGGDVAASVDWTGSGGDWDLEFTTGTIETSQLISTEVAERYNAALSHFRFGTISWEISNPSTRTVDFDIEQSWRRTAYSGSATDGRPDVGDTIYTGSFTFGDGSSSSISLTVTSIDVTNDIVVGRAELTHS